MNIIEKEIKRRGELIAKRTENLEKIEELKKECEEIKVDELKKDITELEEIMQKLEPQPDEEPDQATDTAVVGY